MKHFVTTKIKLATCNRCDSYVWTCQVEGMRATVDPSPLGGIDEYVTALSTGRDCYGVCTVAGRPETLSPVSQSTPVLQRLSRGLVVASHSCGTRAMNSTKVDTTPVMLPKDSASTAAATATDARHPSNASRRREPALTRRCALCHAAIQPAEPYWGIEGLPPENHWEHEKCPT